MSMAFAVKDGVANMRFEAGRCCFGMSISTSPLTRCWHGGGTSNCRSEARSMSARKKTTIIRRGYFSGL